MKGIQKRESGITLGPFKKKKTTWEFQVSDQVLEKITSLYANYIFFLALAQAFSKLKHKQKKLYRLFNILKLTED